MNKQRMKIMEKSKKQLNIPHAILNRRLAFTLSEILITLAIISVIAALTIQPLMKKYQKIETVVRLKKAYTAINSAFRLSEMENGKYKYWKSGYSIGATAFLNKYWLPYFDGYRLCTSYSDCGYSSVQPFKYMNGTASTWSAYIANYRIPFITSDGILYNISVGQGSSTAEEGAVSSSFIFTVLHF